MKQRGFTLIELVVVIIILGILAATALPRFIDLGGDAGDASAKSVAGALSSATAMNYAKYQISSAAATTVTTGTACNALNGMLTSGLPADVSWINAAATITCTGGGDTDTTSCSVVHAQGNTAAGFPVTITCTN